MSQSIAFKNERQEMAYKFLIECRDKRLQLESSEKYFRGIALDTGLEEAYVDAVLAGDL